MWKMDHIEYCALAQNTTKKKKTNEMIVRWNLRPSAVQHIQHTNEWGSNRVRFGGFSIFWWNIS